MPRLGKRMIAAAALAAALVIAPTPARAAFQVKITVHSGPALATAEAVDGGAFDSDAVVNGAILFMQGVGELDLKVSLYTNAPGDPGLAVLGVEGSVKNNGSAAQDLAVFTTSQGLSLP